jgi:hypothetical protein
VPLVAVLGALTFLPWLPLVLGLAAGSVGAGLGCRVDEAGVYPCPLLGSDIGGVLAFLGVLPWISVSLAPVALIGAIAWPLLGALLAARWLWRRGRRSGPGGS